MLTRFHFRSPVTLAAAHLRADALEYLKKKNKKALIFSAFIFYPSILRILGMAHNGDQKIHHFQLIF